MDREPAALSDILISARLVRSYVEGIPLREFLQDTKLQDSVVRRLEIIGEAASRVPADFRERHPTLPWRDMIDMRNRLIHGYDDVDMDLVWDTVQRHVPHLVSRLEAMLSSDSE